MKIGDLVTWHRVIAQGYGDGGSIPAVVVRIGRSRVTIDAALRNGGTKRVSVRPEHLRVREEGAGRDD